MSTHDVPKDPPPQTAWCNVCSTCGPVPDPQDDFEIIHCDCDKEAVGLLVGFIIVILLTLSSMYGAVAVRFDEHAKCLSTATWFRVTVIQVLALGMAAVLLSVGLFRDWYSTEAGHYSTPPCGDRSHTIGLWHSDVKNNDVFLASCPETMTALRATGALIATALSLSLLALVVMITFGGYNRAKRTRDWGKASFICCNLVAFCAVVAALLVHASRVRGSRSFCGSGRSLSDLGYSLLAPYYTTVVATAFLGIGVVSALVGKICANGDDDCGRQAPAEVLSSVPVLDSQYHAL